MLTVIAASTPTVFERQLGKRALGQSEPARGDLPDVPRSGAVQHVAGDVNPVDDAGIADRVEQQRQADTAAEIDVRDDLTRRRSRRLHCRFHHWAVSAVEHDRDALTEQSMWTAKLAVDCAQ